MNIDEAREDLIRYVAELRSMIRSRFKQEGEGLRGGIIERFYTSSPGSYIGLARRTSRAADSWQAHTTESNDLMQVSVFSAGVPYADFSKASFVRGKGWLVIPSGAGVNPGGVSRYPGDSKGKGSIAQAEARLTFSAKKGSITRTGKERPKISFVRKGESILVLAAPGVTGPGITKNKRLLFVMRRVVKRPARTAGLMPFVTFAAKQIKIRLEKEIGSYNG